MIDPAHKTADDGDIAQGEVEDSRMQLGKLEWYAANGEARSCICEVRRRGERGITIVAPRCPELREMPPCAMANPSIASSSKRPWT